MRPRINPAEMCAPRARLVRWLMIDSSEYDFWVNMIEDSLKVARKIPGVTDDYLRRKAVAYRAMMTLEEGRFNHLLKAYDMNPNMIKNLPEGSALRGMLERLARRVRRFRSLHETYSDVLNARTYLKGPDSIVAYIVGITVPEEVPSRLQQMEEEFPAA